MFLLNEVAKPLTNACRTYYDVEQIENDQKPIILSASTPKKRQIIRQRDAVKKSLRQAASGKLSNPMIDMAS
jgi:hypothetical protein